MSLGDESLEWHSILDALKNIPVETARVTLGQRGTVAYTDGACIQNPGGPAGWSVILASVDHVDGEHIREGAPRIECYGHIPESPTTTNNRAEIAAVLAALCLAPRDQPSTIHSDSEYTIKVATGVFKVKANSDLWELYRVLYGCAAMRDTRTMSAPTNWPGWAPGITTWKPIAGGSNPTRLKRAVISRARK